MSGEVGDIRFCWACGRPASNQWGDDEESPEGYNCECCDRPFTACPCSPASDGECTAEKEQASTQPSEPDSFLWRLTEKDRIHDYLWGLKGLKSVLVHPRWEQHLKAIMSPRYDGALAEFFLEVNHSCPEDVLRLSFQDGSTIGKPWGV